MAQTTDGMSMKDCYVGLSTDGTTFTDFSGMTNEVQVSGGERATAGTPTFEGDTQVHTGGKRGLYTVSIIGIYTEGAAEFYAMVDTAYRAGSPLYARWSPKGDDSGEKRFTTAAGIVKNPPYPGGNANSADAILSTCVLETPDITPATVPV